MVYFKRYKDRKLENWNMFIYTDSKKKNKNKKIEI